MKISGLPFFLSLSLYKHLRYHFNTFPYVSDSFHNRIKMWLRNNVFTFICICIIFTYNRVMAVKQNFINFSSDMHASFCMYKEDLGILSYSDSQIMIPVTETCNDLLKQRESNAQIQNGPKYQSKKSYQEYSGRLFPTLNGFVLYEIPLEKPTEFKIIPEEIKAVLAWNPETRNCKGLGVKVSSLERTSKCLNVNAFDGLPHIPQQTGPNAFIF